MIDVFWENENGDDIGAMTEQFDHWRYITDWSEHDGTCCLRFIDEYQDTTFNELQIPVLLRELELLLPKSKDSKAESELKSLLTFIRQAEGQIHTYIKFYGD